MNRWLICGAATVVAITGAADTLYVLRPRWFAGHRPSVRWHLPAILGLLILAVWGTAAMGAAAPEGAFPGCPPQGQTRIARIQALNRLKNRAVPPATTDPAATLTSMLAAGSDLHRFSDGDGASITGYVIRVKPGGVESVNCHAHAIARRDTHIEVAPSATAAATRAVIVEVTPRWRTVMHALGIDWSTRTLEQVLPGHLVTFRGWLFLDAEHTNASETDNPGNAHDWRGTAWEIHPVTSICVHGVLTPANSPGCH